MHQPQSTGSVSAHPVDAGYDTLGESM